jgi:hypothetical protein
MQSNFRSLLAQPTLTYKSVQRCQRMDAGLEKREEEEKEERRYRNLFIAFYEKYYYY